MAKPVVSTEQITPRNGELSGLTYVFEVGTPVILKFGVSSSGNDRPYAKHQIDWGDGDVVTSDSLPIGREFQSHHAYSQLGEYVVKITAINLGGEESDLTDKTVIRVRNEPIPPEKATLFKWRGLAMPFRSIADNLSAIQDNFIETVGQLAQDGVAGSDEIVVVGDGAEFEVGAQVTIEENDKLITSCRISATRLNVLQLDVNLNDDYSKENARVHVKRKNLGRRFHKDLDNQEWYFPRSVDEELVRSSIAAILSTRPMERVMLPKFGSLLNDIPFEQNDFITESLTRQYVIEAIRTWEPRAEIIDTTISGEGHDIMVSVSIKVNTNTFAIDFTINELLSL
jgi:phage baseplate assembly protein W